MQASFFTLGYEGLTIEAFIARLQNAHVKTAVDVRELPLYIPHGLEANLTH